MGITLRYPYEIRNEAEYFGDLPDEKVPKELLDLATHIVATRSGHFRPEKFEDHYELALRELIKRKQRGEKIAKPKERPPAKVIDLMEALRASLEKKPAKRAQPAQPAKPVRKAAGKK